MSDWISVKDRLPESFSRVFFYSKDYGVEEGFYGNPNSYYHTSEEIVFVSDNEYRERKTTTHWMEFPKIICPNPPEEE